ncbi:MAG: hypothetical protein EPO06_12030 [Burkholderiaceae bacterium]|nr:MAG: hypothetical protein EPO06_12030 [Burkholderiaceae bacterium]
MADDLGRDAGGAVGIDVFPDDRQFETRLRAAVLPPAQRVGQEIGRVIAAPMAARIADGVLAGVRDGARAAQAAGTKAGSDTGAAFGRAMRTRIDAALRSLPRAKLDADTSELDAKIAAARAKLEALGHASAGGRVTLDSGDTAAEVQRLRNELAALARDVEKVKAAGGKIPLDVDVFGAMAEITALKQEIASLKETARRNPVRVTTDGKFAADLREHVAKAAAALPEIELHADSSDADRAVAEIRENLRALSKRSVGVDIDDATAIAEIRRLQERLAELAKSTPSVRVSVDAAAAVAELETVRAEAARLAKLNPTIRVDVDAGEATASIVGLEGAAAASSEGIGGLAAAGITLGPAIVPAAGIAAAAISGIGVAAIAAGAGLGVTILGLIGVVGAVHAMSAANAEAGTSAATLASKQASVASATDSVRSAEVAYQQAQERQVIATQDLTRAREQAKRALEDVNEQVRKGALDLRQAEIDLTKAAQERDRVVANNAASKLQKDQAQLSYEQAKENLTDLTNRQKRLGEDQQKAQRDGIEGSSQVVAAQRAIEQAQIGVESATRQLAASHRSLAVASETATAAASGQTDATRKLQQAMAGLSPEGRRFATFLYGLRGNVTELRHAAEAGLLPGFQQAITTLLPAMPAVTGAVGLLASTVGGLAAKGAQAFTAPFWRQFFPYLIAVAVPALKGMAKITYDVALGVAGMLQAFLPVEKTMGRGLVHLADNFAYFGEHAAKNEKFQQFVAFAVREGPHLVHILGEVVSALVHVGEAVAPVGGAVLVALGAFSRIISAIPIPVLTALAAAIVAVVAAQKAWALVTTLQEKASLAWTAVQVGYLTAVEKYQTHMAAATVETGRFGGALTTVKAASGAARSGLSSLVSTLGGPWGVALAGATIAVGLITEAYRAQKQRVDELAGALGQLGDAYRQTHDVDSQAVKDVITHNKALTDLVNTSKTYGLTVQQIAAASAGEATSQEQVLKGLRARREELLRQNAAENSSRASNGRPRGLIDDLFNPDGGKSKASADRAIEADAIKEREKALQKEFDQTSAQARAMHELAEAHHRDVLAGHALTDSQQAIADAMKVVNDETASGADKADALRIAQDKLSGSAIAASDAEEAYASSLLATQKQLESNTEGIGLNSETSIANRDALKAQILASKDMYDAEVRNNVSVEDATKHHQDRIAALLKEKDVTRLNAGEVQKLVDTYGKIPTDVKTQLDVFGYDNVQTQLRNLEILQYILQHPDMDPKKAAEEAEDFHRESQRRATGGMIEGPGSKTSDSVKALLSRGEFVQQAAAVDYYGPAAMYALNARQIPKQWLHGYGPARRLAGGGMVWPFTVDVSKTYVPPLSVIQAQAAQSGRGGLVPALGPVAPGTTWPGIVEAARHSGVPFVVTSTLRPGAPDWHGQGKAADMAASPANMAALAAFFYRFAPYLLEEIHSGGGGFFVKNHARVGAGYYGPQLVAQHYNHVHIAADSAGVAAIRGILGYDSGGYIPPGMSIVDNRTGKPEPVFNDEQWKTLHAAVNRGGAGGRGDARSLVHIDNYHASEDPSEVARDLDWLSRHGG